MKESLYKLIESENEQYVLSNDGKEISCALIIQSPEGEILACHSTGKGWGKTTFDLPKGHLNTTDKDAVDAAIRECREETGIDVSSLKDRIEDLGEFKYTSYKNLHLFRIIMEIPDLKTLHCDSTFIDYSGKERPEVNGFAKVKLGELDWFFKSIQKVLSEAGIR